MSTGLLAQRKARSRPRNPVIATVLRMLRRIHIEQAFAHQVADDCRPALLVAEVLTVCMDDERSPPVLPETPPRVRQVCREGWSNGAPGHIPVPVGPAVPDLDSISTLSSPMRPTGLHKETYSWLLPPSHLAGVMAWCPQENPDRQTGTQVSSCFMLLFVLAFGRCIPVNSSCLSPVLSQALDYVSVMPVHAPGRSRGCAARTMPRGA